MFCHQRRILVSKRRYNFSHCMTGFTGSIQNVVPPISGWFKMIIFLHLPVVRIHLNFYTEFNRFSSFFSISFSHLKFKFSTPETLRILSYRHLTFKFLENVIRLIACSLLCFNEFFFRVVLLSLVKQLILEAFSVFQINSSFAIQALESFL